MRYTFFLTLGLLITSIVNGQDNKLSVGLVGSLNSYCYNFKTVPLIGFDHKYDTKINYSAGVRIQYSFNKRFALRTGLAYSTKGYVVDYSWIYFDPNDPLVPKKSISKSGYLDIPLLVNYNFINGKKISLYASTGILTSVFIHDKEVSVMEDGSKKETDFFKTWFNQKLNKTLFAIEFDIGLRYSFIPKLYLTIEPYFKYGLNKIDNGLLKTNPISYGGILGCHYNIK